MNTPLVSIIVPVYNVELYLKQCLDSLVGQTLKDIEIICVDDGSTDGSPAILQEYAAQDERIRIVTQTNKGVSIARNEGMDTARAPYIMFCDPDDWYELNMCERMYHALDGVDVADMAMCGTQPEYEYEVSQRRLWGDENFFSIRHSGLTELSGDMLLIFSKAVWNKIFRRAFLLEHHIQFPKELRYEDVYFFEVCLAHVTHMAFVQDKLYHYRQWQGSFMFGTVSNEPLSVIDRLRVSMRLWVYYKEHGLLRKWNGYIVKVWIRSLRLCLASERTKKARKLIAKMAHDFIEDNDQCTHALSDEERREIIRLMNSSSSSPAVQSIKNRVKKRLINMLPVAVWRRRLRRRYL